MWLWIGGLVAVAGAVVSIGPSGRRRRPRELTAPGGPPAEESIELHDQPHDQQPAGSEVGAAV
jgi:hypothetical protein